MATLVLTALGTALGGPLGGAIGSLIGNRIDRAAIGGPHREGPRLRELAVTTSSYGAPIPRHFGTMRAAGSVIWATDLKETSETRGGGKGRPSRTTYAYSASFAVALASRPIRRIGRIWADGNLLRGAAGDLKTGGALRIYQGYGDQAPDPLIASAVGGACPAFRGLAYCVFESLQLADFGNRIPALTFEIVADDGEVSLAEVAAAAEPLDAGPGLPGLKGFSDEGGPLAATLATIDQVYPLACDAGGERLTIRSASTQAADPPLLPEAAVEFAGEGFGGQAGRTLRRQSDAREIPDGLRYYDPARDFQVGLQRADGRARPGRGRVLEFPGALDAGAARALANAAAERAGWRRELLAWRVAELDPSLAPGTVVRVPGHAGPWLIETWEWRERGVELELCLLPPGAARQTPADPGTSLPAVDLVATPTLLEAYELPWDGFGAADARRVYAAVSSQAAGWTGAALYAAHGGELMPIGPSGRERSVIGRLVEPLPGTAAMLFDRVGAVEIELASIDFQLAGATASGLANGANRALLGGEVLQFAEAAPLGGRRWRLRGLLRGRGGTEAAALAGHPADTPFVLLDASAVRIEPEKLGAPAAEAIAAIGLADAEPVTSAIANPGATLRPLTPVHPRVAKAADGGIRLTWARRSRGAWNWPDGVDLPLNEQSERYTLGLGDADAPVMRWEATEPRLDLSAALLDELTATHSGRPLWVRQMGSSAVSDPLLVTTIP